MNPNLFWCIIGILGGAVVSFLISFLFYFKSLKRKRLTYDIKTFCIISNKVNMIENLEIKYNSDEINNLFSSEITIKNIGNSIIEKNDFAPSHPLSITTSEKFLINQKEQINLLTLNKASNVYPTFNETSNRIYIVFDYIVKNDMLTCSILHTGDIALEGILKDGKIITPIERQKIKKRNSILREIFSYIIILLIILFVSSLLKN